MNLKRVGFVACCATVGLVVISWQAIGQERAAETKQAATSAAATANQKKAPDESKSIPVDDSGQAIAKALDTKTATVQFAETPLKDVAKQLGETFKVPIHLDLIALEEIGMDEDTPITFAAKSMHLRSILSHICRPIDLWWNIKSEVLLISSRDVSEEETNSRIFPVSDLTMVRLPDNKFAHDYDTLISVIETIIEPDTWVSVGGVGSQQPFRGSIVCSQYDSVLDHVEMFLAALRKTKSIKVIPGRAQPNVTVNQLRHQIEIDWNQRVSFSFNESPLSELVDRLAKLLNKNVYLDETALEEIGLGKDTPVTSNLKDLTLRSSLGLTLRPLGLDWMIRDESLVITSLEACEGLLDTRLYPIGKLAKDGNADNVIEVITNQIEPDSWDEVGGPGAIAFFPATDTIVISQTDTTQRKIERLLTKLHAANQVHEAAKLAAKEKLGVYANIPVIKPKLQLRTYVLPGKQGKSKGTINPDAVIAMVKALLEDEWGDEKGTAIHLFENRLMVRHYDRVHQRVLEILHQSIGWVQVITPDTRSAKPIVGSVQRPAPQIAQIER